jgi:hypothetical protein
MDGYIRQGRWTLDKVDGCTHTGGSWVLQGRCMHAYMDTHKGVLHTHTHTHGCVGHGQGLVSGGLVRV